MPGRVLVIDDLDINRRLLEARLVHQYYQVLLAKDGPTGLKLAQDEAPDIILLDVMMPGMDGYEVCRRLKAGPQTAHIPVVMVTALGERDDRLRGLAAGADDFLTKPISDVVLSARVRSLIRLKTVLDELRLREQTSRQLGSLGDAAAGGSATAHARVLIVDDDAADIALIGAHLGGDHSVEALSDPSQLPERARAGDFDLLIVSLTIKGVGRPAPPLAAPRRHGDAAGADPGLGARGRSRTDRQGPRRRCNRLPHQADRPGRARFARHHASPAQAVP